MQFSKFFKCLGCTSMGGDDSLISILTASGVSRILERLCFGGSLSGLPGDQLFGTDAGRSV